MRLMPLTMVKSWPWLGFMVSNSGFARPVGSLPTRFVVKLTRNGSSDFRPTTRPFSTYTHGTRSPVAGMRKL